MADPFRPWRDQMPPAPVRIARDLRLDLFRGLALAALVVRFVLRHWRIARVPGAGAIDRRTDCVFLRAEFLLAFERLQGKEGLHKLPPKPRLISAEPVDEFTVQIGQAQEANRDVPRWDWRVGSTPRAVRLCTFALGRTISAT
jgi:hypothetical protein